LIYETTAEERAVVLGGDMVERSTEEKETARRAAPFPSL
jgi:hypothetical protein